MNKLKQYAEQGKIVGDLGGHLILAADLQPESDLKQFVYGISGRMLACQPGDFMTVADRHRTRQESSGAGVVCASAGARKAKVLHALLSLSSCPLSCVVLDTHCALALLRLMATPKAVDDFWNGAEGKWLRLNHDHWSQQTRSLIDPSR